MIEAAREVDRRDYINTRREARGGDELNEERKGMRRRRRICRNSDNNV